MDPIDGEHSENCSKLLRVWTDGSCGVSQLIRETQLFEGDTFEMACFTVFLCPPLRDHQDDDFDTK
jgi:hypothetical protein